MNRVFIFFTYPTKISGDKVWVLGPDGYSGATALSNRAINYVFSSNNLVGENWTSPFTKKSIDYVLSTTKKNLNEWVSTKVNVKDHFKKFHNLDLDEISGVAIMSDTDNSKLNSIAYYQNIYFSSN